MRLQIKWRDGWAWAHGTGPDGKRIRRALKTKDPVRAEELRTDLETRLWRSEIYGPETTITFAECALEYAKDGGDTRFLSRVADELSGVRLADITPKRAREAAKAAYPNCANSTINRQGVTPIRAVVNYGHDQGWCSPLRVKGFPVEKPKRRAVDPDYLVKLKPHLPQRLFALMVFLQTTGRRVGEAVALTPENLDLETGRAFIPKTKNGESATAHIGPFLADLIKQFEPMNGRVFGYRDPRSIYGTIRRACKKAGVPYLGTHQPGRHTFATELDKEGWSAPAIASAGGWKSVRMVSEVYTHPDSPAERATDVLGTKLAQSLSAAE